MNSIAWRSYFDLRRCRRQCWFLFYISTYRN